MSPNTTFSVSLTINISVDTNTHIFLGLQQIHPYINEWADSIQEEVGLGDLDKTYTLSATAPTEAREVSYIVHLSYWDESASDWVVMDKVNAFFITTYVPWRTLESDPIMIVFREEPPATEYVDNVEALLQYLEQAHELLQEWTGNTPYLGLKIGIVYNSTITGEFGESVSGLAGNPIQIKDYPTADTESELQTYFHELSPRFHQV